MAVTGKAEAETLLPLFKTERLLNQDQDGRRVSLYGQIHSQPAVLVIERAPFPSSTVYLSGIAGSLARLRNLGANDVYRWYLGSLGSSSALGEEVLEREGKERASLSAAAEAAAAAATADTTASPAPKDGNEDGGEKDAADDTATTAFDLKLNLFYPASDKHVRKYSKQRMHVVHETADIYSRLVRPHVSATHRAEGRLKWIYDILEGRAEVEDVIYRSGGGSDEDEGGMSEGANEGGTGSKGEGNDSDGSEGDGGFVLLPDLNWDRCTMDALHLLALVRRRDVWSVRDLRVKHLPWLRAMRRRIVEAALLKFPEVEEDQLKLYLHYPPTYYHMHVHVVHVSLDGGGSQAVGKAIGYDSIIAQLEHMSGDDEAGMHNVTMTYSVGEENDLWKEIWGPMKSRKS